MKAPWEVIPTPESSNQRFIVKSGRTSVASVCYDTTDEANANLIAAAPDLYAACEAVLLFHSVDWTITKEKRWAELTGERDATTKSLCDFVRKMMAKAEGR